MSETTNTGDIMYSNNQFNGPNTAGDDYEVNKISCELGEIYFQKKVGTNDETGISSSSNSNGLFISNDKLQELVNSGQISKYSWLMQFVLKNKINFLQPAKDVGFEKTGSGNNPSTYYKNGIFVPLTFRERGKKDKLLGRNKDKIVFKLPYDNKLKLSLYFNNSNINAKDIRESIIEYKNGDKNRFGVKEEYKNTGQSSHSGAFFVLKDGKDVTPQVPMVVKDVSIDKKKINGKSVMYLPTDFDKNKNIADFWKNEKPKVINFLMVPDGNGALRLKMHETSLLKQIVYDWAQSHFTPPVPPTELVTYNDANKEYIIEGGFNPSPIKITIDTKKFNVSADTAPGIDPEKNDFLKLAEDLRTQILKFEAANVSSTNNNICNLLNQSGFAVDIDKDVIKGKTAILNNDEKPLVLDNVCGLNYNDNEVHSYISGDPDYKEVRLYKDNSNNKTYYCEYNPANGQISDPKELGDKTILHCRLGKPEAYVMKKNNDKWVTISTKRQIRTDPAGKKADINGVLKDPDIENFLNGVKQEYDSGQINKIFKQESGESLAEKVKQKLGNKFDIQTESNGVVKPICTYIPPAGGEPGKFELKNGEVKPLNNVDDIKESLKKEDEEAIKAGIENDKTTVLSDGALYDFCASQIGATKPQQQNAVQVEEEDPIKAKAQEYFRNINLFMPGASFKPHVNKHMEKKMKKINNANGFNVTFKPHINKHMEKKMKKINNLSGFAQVGNGTGIG